MTNYLFQLSTKFDKYEADKYVCISVGMPVVNSSLSSHHFSPSKVVKVVFRNLVRARTELIEAQAVCLVMLDYGPEIDPSSHSLLFVALVLPPKVPVALAAHDQA